MSFSSINYRFYSQCSITSSPIIFSYQTLIFDICPEKNCILSLLTLLFSGFNIIPCIRISLNCFFIIIVQTAGKYCNSKMAIIITSSGIFINFYNLKKKFKNRMYIILYPSTWRKRRLSRGETEKIKAR